MAHGQTFAVEIARELKEADAAKKKISAYLKKKHTPDDVIANCELALYEVLVNIVEHGSDRFRSETISVTCEVDGKRVLMKVSNKGDQFDLTRTGLPDIVSHYRSGKNRGLGIYFVRTLMDEVNYSFNDKINVLELIKYAGSID